MQADGTEGCSTMHQPHQQQHMLLNGAALENLEVLENAEGKYKELHVRTHTLEKW